MYFGPTCGPSAASACAGRGTCRSAAHCRHVQPKSLLDTAPLRALLARIPLPQIEANVRSGALHAVAVAATDLYTSNGFLFVHGHPDIRPWKRSRWRIERRAPDDRPSDGVERHPDLLPVDPDRRPAFRRRLHSQHRAAQPGDQFGCRPDHRHRRAGAGSSRADRNRRSLPPPTIAQIAGVLLDAVMLDAIETDVEHSGRVNRSVLSCRGADSANPFRWIDVLWLTPSVDFGAIAAELSDHVPPIVRYLMRGLGSDEAISELLSYLLFAPAFTRRLIEIGRTDALAAKAEIRRFFSQAAGREAARPSGTQRG